MKSFLSIIIGVIIGAAAVTIYFNATGNRPFQITGQQESNRITPTEKELFQKGQSFLYAGDNSAAIDNFRQFENEHPKSKLIDEVLYWSAYCLRELKDYQGSISKYEHLIQDYPNSKWAPEAEFNIASIYERDLKDYDKAVQLYQKLSDKYPGTDWSIKGTYRNAQINDRLGKINDAENEYNKVCKDGQQQKKQQVQTESNYFIQQAKKKLEFINAHSDFDRKPLSLFTEAQGLKEENKHLEAVNKLKTIIKDYPKSSLVEQAYINIIRIYRTKGLATEAEVTLDQLKKEFPESKYLNTDNIK